MLGTQDNGDGTTATWRDESWQSTSAPYQRRQVEQSSDTPRAETGTVNGHDALYDATTKTIYVSDQSSDSSAADGASADSASASDAPTPAPTSDASSTAKAYSVGSGATASAGVLVAVSGRNLQDVLTKVKTSAKADHLTAAQVTTVERQLARLKSDSKAKTGPVRAFLYVTGTRVGVKVMIGNTGGTDRSAGASSGSAASGSAANDTSAGASDEMFRQDALAALKSPATKAIGHVTVDGRDAIKIVVSSSTTYLVDAQTYDPIEWITKGTTGGVVLRFDAYEQLQPTADNLALLSLTVQHPGATVDTNASDYDAATGRLFPKG